MAVSYATKSLGNGTVGGRGIWLIRDSSYYNLANAYDTNLCGVRTVAEATTFNTKMPFIGDGTKQRLAFRAGGEANGYQWCTRLFSYIYTDGQFQRVRRMSNLEYLDVTRYESGTIKQRHAHRVLYDNTNGYMLSSVERIPVGTAGYSDPLPGLFSIEPVAGSIVSGVSMQVNIREYDNRILRWEVGNSSVITDNYCNYGSVHHPYLRDGVTVSIASGNVNTHVIPGVAITFNTVAGYGNKSMLAIGYEYVNSRSELGEMGSIEGSLPWFQPQTNMVTQFGEIVTSLDQFDPEYYYYYLAYPDPVWRIYNVTGDILEDCRFHIRSLVRLDQAMSPATAFSQWYMGCREECQLTESLTPYTLLFHSFVAGSPNTIGVSVSGDVVGTTIVEIDSDTYLPTGIIHNDGKGLKCDGTTLYRWDEMGVYFVLATTAASTSTAYVWLRYGKDTMSWLDDTAYNHYVPDPLVREITIGTWDCVYDVDEDVMRPGVPCTYESSRTGIIQTQGHEYEFFLATLDPVATKWYNHNTEIATFLRPCYRDEGEGYFYDEVWSPYELAVMVTCDDPRYFVVAPVMWTWQLARDEYSSPSPGGNWNKMSLQVAVPDEDTSFAGSMQVQSVDRSLVIRANQIPSALADLLSDHGVEIE